MPCHPCLPLELIEKLKNDPAMMISSSKVFESNFEKFRRGAVKLEERERVEVEVVSPDSPDNLRLSHFQIDEDEDEDEDIRVETFSFHRGDRKTLLHSAAHQGDVPLVYELIRLGHQIDWTDTDGRTALWVALSSLVGFSGSPAIIVRVSEQSGLKPGDINWSRKIECFVRVATVLIEQHIDVNIGYGCVSPLSLAVEARRWDLVELLLIHGARPEDLAWTDHNEAVLRRFYQICLTTKPVNPRPPRPCPCWSGKRLSECHGAGEHPYPNHFLCVCGARKTYVDCCRKRGIEIVEKWIPEWGIMPRQIIKPRFPSENHVAPEDRPSFNRGTEILQQAMKNFVFTPEQVLAFQTQRSKLFRDQLAFMDFNPDDVDKAFWYALDHVDQFPPRYVPVSSLDSEFNAFYRPWTTQISKKEAQKRMEEWNEAVDKYIAERPLYIDRRPDLRLGSVIEIEAKVGLNGGPLYRHCEADGCSKVEKRDIEQIKSCSGCKRVSVISSRSYSRLTGLQVFYCSENCQRRSWKAGHKAECKAGTHPLQLSKSQLILERMSIKSQSELAQHVDLFGFRL